MKKLLKYLPIGLTALVLVAAGITYFASTPQKVEATFNGYTYQRTLTVANASSTQSNFPVLVCFNSTPGTGSCPTATDLKASSSAGSIMTLGATGLPNDLVFSTSSLATGLLPFEIEKYSSTTGETIAWVNMPTVANGQVLYMYYGKSGDTSHQNATGVWDTNYKGVWHLPNGTILTTNDSTSNANNGTATSVSATTGMIDGGVLTSGGSSYVKGGAPGVTAFPFTLEVWAKLASGALANNTFQGMNLITQFTTSEFYGIFWARDDSSGGTQLRMYGNDTSGNLRLITHTFTTDTNFHHLVAVYTNATTYALYIDGSAVSIDNTFTGGTGTPSPDSNMDTTVFGSMLVNSAVQNSFTGTIDETRVSNVVRSANWIATEYNNQSNDNTFWTTSGATTGTTPQYTRVSVLNSRLSNCNIGTFGYTTIGGSQLGSANQVSSDADGYTGITGMAKGITASLGNVSGSTHNIQFALYQGTTFLASTSIVSITSPTSPGTLFTANFPTAIAVSSANTYFIAFLADSASVLVSFTANAINNYQSQLRTFGSFPNPITWSAQAVKDQFSMYVNTTVCNGRTSITGN